MAFFAIIVGWSDNAYLALAALFGFIPFYAFRTKTGAKRYLMMLAVFATVAQIYIDAFLIGAMLVCLWGISDFFQLDIFGFRVDLSPGDKPNFTSSFGNINTYTAYLSFVIGVSGTMFIATAKSKRLIWYTICIAISFFAILPVY